jgi:RNA polymerase sigma-70 factor (ECF subfamily)
MEEINKDVIELAKNGDERSMSEIFQYYKDYVMRSSFLYLHRLDEAEDVTENVFLKIFTNLKSFNMEKDFRPWLSRIIMNECHNYYHKNRGEYSNSDEMIDLIANTDTSFETVKLIRDCFKNLTGSEREILTMRFFQELTIEEIASVLRISVGNVKVKIHRSLKRLKELVKNDA